MPDALDHLAKLPPRCAANIEGSAVMIVRGANKTMPAFLAGSSVEKWNQDHGVTPEQVQAMLVGVTLGWDMEGADPDTHAADLGSPEHVGPFGYRFMATVLMEVTMVGPTIGTAEAAARLSITEVLNRQLQGYPHEIEFPLDLIETDDPR